MPKQRESKYNEPGQVGRITGQRMPTNVPRDEDGMEDVDAFFGTSPGSTGRARVNVASVKRPGTFTQVDKARGARPDLHHDLGKVGRKTGQVYKDARKMSNGLEDPDDFFNSPNTTARSLAPPSKKQRKSNAADQSVEMGRRADSRRLTDYGDRSTIEEEDTDDMSLDNGSGLSPGRYMNKSITQSPQSRRTSYQSGPPSGSRSVNGASPRNKPLKAKQPSPTPDSDEEQSQSEEENREDDTPPAVPRRDKGKGKGRASVSDNEQSFAQDYGGGQEDDTMDVEQEDEPSIEEEAAVERSQSETPPAPRRPALPAKTSTQVTKKKDKPPPKASGTPKVKHRKPHKRDFSVETEGLRRSSRPTEPPVAFWRGEKVVYERRKSGWTMKEVVRTEEVPQKMAVDYGKGKRGGKRRRPARAKSTPTIKEDPEGEQRAVEEDIYEGWDDGTDADGLTWDFLERTEKTRRIAFPKRLVDPGVVAKGAYKFQKIFSDGEYMACGILEIPIGSKKPIKSARDNSYMLYVEKGVVQVLVYRTTFPIARGGFFFVPRGNTYEIENIGEHPCRLVFAQAREVKVATDVDMMEEDEEYGPPDPGMEGDASRYQTLDAVEEEEDEQTESDQ